MKKFTTRLLSLLVLTMFVCCAPANKESYMERYRDFIDEVAENYKSWSASDWKKAQERFDDFSGDWYDKFKDKLTTKEQVLVTGYGVKFNYYYARSQSKDVVDGIMELFSGENVQQFIDNIKEEGGNALQQLEQLFDNL